MRSWTAVRLGLVAAGLAAAGGTAAAQPARTWKNDTAGWELGTSWVEGSPPTSGQGALFSTTATGANPTAVSPVFTGATNQASLLTIVNSPAGGGTYNLLAAAAGARVTLFSSASNTVTPITPTNATAAVSVFGGGTTTLDPNLTLAFNGGAFLYAQGGSVLDLAGLLAAPSGNLSFRVDGATASSAFRFRSANTLGAASTVSLGNSSGTSAGRYEIGVNSPFGTNTLNANGGSGGGFSLIPYDPAGGTGVTRVVGNPTVNLGIGTITFGDTGATGVTTAQQANNNGNSLVFTGAAFLGSTSAATRTYALAINNAANGNPLLSTAAVVFNGNTSLRAAGNNTAATVNLQGVGRLEVNGVLSNGDGSNNSTAANLAIGTGNGAVVVRLGNPGNTFSGTTALNSGGLIVGAAGALGPATSTLTVGTGTGAVDRYLLLDTAAGDNSTARPVSVAASTFTGNANLPGPPVTVLGTTPGGTNTGTFSGSLTLGTLNNAPTLPVILNAGPLGAAVFSGTFARTGTFTGPVNVQANATLGGVAGGGTVTVAGTQSAGLNALSGVSAGQFILAGGTNWDTGRGFLVGGGTAVVNGTLTNNSAAGGTVQVGAGIIDVRAGTTGTTNAGTLAGVGTINLPVTVNPGATLAPGPLAGTGILTATAGVSVFGAAGNGGRLATQLATDGAGTITAASYVALSGAGSNLNLDSTAGPFAVVLNNDAGLTLNRTYTVTLATAAAGSNFLRNGTVYDAGTNAFTPADFALVSGSGTQTFDTASLFVSGTFLQLTFTPVPEPATVLAVAALGLGAVRRRRTT